jgi:hypothetical protein
MMDHDDHDDRLDSVAAGDHDGTRYNDSWRWRRGMEGQREFLRPDLCYENFHGKMLRVGDRRFMLVAFDRSSTMGIVTDENKKPVLGWSRDEPSNMVHVLGREDYERRGPGLEDTVTVALLDLLSTEKLS